jgi:hypothetical protein
MGKSYRKDARNDSWRKAKQQKHSKSHSGGKSKSYSPFEDPSEYHESFAGDDRSDNFHDDSFDGN